MTSPKITKPLPINTSDSLGAHSLAGRHSARFQRGTSALSSHRFRLPTSDFRVAALAWLFLVSLAQLPALAQNYQTQPTQLLETAKQSYRQQNYQQSVNLLQQAAKRFANQQNTLNQALVLSNLSLTHQQLGNWELAQQAIAESLQLLENYDDSSDKLRVLAPTLSIQGQLQRKTGQTEMAVTTFQQAAELYAQIDNQAGVAESQINQAQALQELGLYPRACKTLLKTLELDSSKCQLDKEALNNLFTASLTDIETTALLSLANIFRITGNLQKSELILTKTRKLAIQLDSETSSKTLLNLANTQRSLANRARELRNNKQAKDYRQKALSNYQQATNETNSIIIKFQAQLNQFSLFIEERNWQKAEQLGTNLINIAVELPADRLSIYAQINLARNLVCLSEKNHNCLNLTATSRKLNPRLHSQSLQLLETAIKEAQKLGDRRSQSYALGNLGQLYEQFNQVSIAQKYTEQALKLAQSIQAEDIAYQWYWQLARLAQTEDTAVTYYSKAFNLLENLRSDLVALNPEVQFSFRESVEPVYRQYANFLLRSEHPSQENLQTARDVIEALQLAELDNFFRDACLDAQPVAVDEIDPTAAVFHTIILRDRLEVIVAIPGQPLRNYSTPLTRSRLELTLQATRRNLANPVKSALNNYLQELYNWIIHPVEQELSENPMETLVFIMDGLLRNIPPAALYDGQKYLIEKYRVALAPTLQLIDPQPFATQKLEMLTAGISQATQGFSALPGVEIELAQIQSEIATQVLLNETFTELNFNQKFQTSPYQIVHLATHGEFSSQAEDTFVLAWDERIDVNELSTLLRSEQRETKPIELLVLSACQTAVGDERAALGLAGVAVRAGARSTIASLWYVSDEATSQLMSKFYEELANNKITKSEAFQRAQLLVLKNQQFSHPYHWSAFVLIGNWL